MIRRKAILFQRGSGWKRAQIRARISATPPSEPPSKLATSLDETNATATEGANVTIQILADSSLDTRESALRLNVQSTMLISELLERL